MDVIFTQRDPNRTKFKVEHGSPFAQKYLLSIYWQEMHLDKITKDPNAAAKSVNKDDGLLFYQVGPPYIATARDMHQIVLKWSEYGVDALDTDHICELSKDLVTGDESMLSSSVPSVIHFCQRYFLVGNWFFSKYNAPTNIFECDSPLFEEPPDNLKATEIDWAVTSTKQRHELDPQEAKRYAFMICALTAAVNDTSIFFKKQH
jgi:hypothetical protein